MVRTMSEPRRLFGDSLFPLAKVVATQAIMDLMAGGPGPEGWVLDCLYRHARGDCGDLCEEDEQANDDALDAGDPGRILSAYVSGEYGKIWIITEWDRTITTILRPEEY